MLCKVRCSWRTGRRLLKFLGLQSGLRLLSYGTAAAKLEETVNPTEPSCNTLPWVSDYSPCFGIQGSSVEILRTPDEFYQTLKKNFRGAKKRIVIASLYLGTGQLEEELVNAIEYACERAKDSKNKDFEVHILLDYNRGSRGGDVSSRTMLTPLLERYSGTVQVYLYHTPDLSGYLKKYLPPKMDETVGVQHMKVYMFDDSLVMSGANLSDNYFTNRQDRYVLFNDCPEMCDFFTGLVKTVSTFSLSLEADNSTRLHHNWEIHPYEGNNKGFKKAAGKTVTEYVRSVRSQQEDMQAKKKTKCDTYVYPLVQMALFGIRTEESFVKQLLRTASDGVKISLATGYFNLTKHYQNIIVLESLAKFDLLIASPQVNGFYGARGVIGNIPDAYTYIASSFYHLVLYHNMQHRIRLYEYYRDQWTYHVKGLWYYLPNQTLPFLCMMGSSNFGHRSVYRDLECQIALVTQNKQLQSELHREQEYFFAHGIQTDEDTYQKADRFVPYWVRLTSPFIRRYL
ncbi:CDP-diacylglycerol--glycerol-3-phosphate 3-phosphatidyltransferase, mitochondrial-like [Saccostrea echinata]|uniref:CDP-diacylglycerol--glycerol-3-phosphate 3-phosphatidyltransferase, mitochondrial-like n=1 Tax=Saccostrea echinata TaxID=191078 RepID=UPI002A8183A0|nr:CDP-diacylglycerol--glycerol-3-phosphate 3-phosphatidyltransferase, mitochondrial-like [Saccostrea echinata]